MAKSAISETVVVPGLYADLPIPTQATTSRTVVSNDAARVVSFAMDTGQELTDHSAPRPAVIQLLEGELSFTTAGEQHELSTGDVVYLAPNERHALVARTPCRFVLVLVTAARAAQEP